MPLKWKNGLKPACPIQPLCCIIGWRGCSLQRLCHCDEWVMVFLSQSLKSQLNSKYQFYFSPSANRANVIRRFKPFWGAEEAQLAAFRTRIGWGSGEDEEDESIRQTDGQTYSCRVIWGSIHTASEFFASLKESYNLIWTSGSVVQNQIRRHEAL